MDSEQSDGHGPPMKRPHLMKDSTTSAPSSDNGYSSLPTVEGGESENQVATNEDERLIFNTEGARQGLAAGVRTLPDSEVSSSTRPHNGITQARRSRLRSTLIPDQTSVEMSVDRYNFRSAPIPVPDQANFTNMWNRLSNENMFAVNWTTELQMRQVVLLLNSTMRVKKCHVSICLHVC